MVEFIFIMRSFCGGYKLFNSKLAAIKICIFLLQTGEANFRLVIDFYFKTSELDKIPAKFVKSSIKRTYFSHPR